MEIWKFIFVLFQYQCCGIDGPADYRRGASAVPWSCCIGSTEPQHSACMTIYQRGCLFVLVQQIKMNLMHCAVGALLTSVFQVTIY